MEELFLDLKTRYGKANISLLNSEIIEIHFKKASEPVIIQKETINGRFTVSYPNIKTNNLGSKEEYTTSHNLLLEGLLWILKKVNRNGKVLPEI